MLPLLLLLSAPGADPADERRSPATEWAAALEDARKLPPEIAKGTRYLSLYAVPSMDRAAWRAVLTFHLWSLSREAEPPQPRRVGATLLAIYLPDYGWPGELYGRLTFRDPYFHVRLTADGRKAIDDVPSPAPWVGRPADQDELRKLCVSQAPLLRADWFFVETSIQDGRGKVGESTGYYDWIGVKDRDTFFKAVGADPKKADELKRRWRAIVKESGISQLPRQIERFDAIGGGLWFTMDFTKDGKGGQNALRNLGGDLKHDAEEHYAIGPAGLPWVMLCNDKGELQNFAPPEIGSDTTRPGNRKTIDCAASCIRCHKEILRPIDNWVSEALKVPATAEVDYAKAVEVRRLYFRDLQGKLKRDREAFAERLHECNGYTPAKNAETYARCWDWYFEGRLTLEQAARECGVSPKRLATVLIAVQAQKKLDPVLIDLVREPPGTVRREGWEEVFPIVQTYLGGPP